MSRLHVVGVRHHSPACARLVEHTLRTVRPRYVLIEGPCDMNARLDELRLEHRLPVAVFTFYHDALMHRASYSPFCEFSPEWVALRVGTEQAADVRFMDLPAWHPAFGDTTNRYSDRPSRVEALCRRLQVDNVDTLWDTLCEQYDSIEELANRLTLYFDEIRAEGAVNPSDTIREAFMADCIGWALGRDDGDVVAVCGGFHAPVLRQSPPRGGDFPATPECPGRCGSYLVPFSFQRMDSFTGYDSGMPSPAWYQSVWDRGPEPTGEAMMWNAVYRLRGHVAVSPADAIAAAAQAQGLAHLRGHRFLHRVDVLDGLASALVKDALDVPLPWTRRARVSASAHPALVEMLAALRGDRAGRLHPSTPRPALVADARSVLEAHGLLGTTVTLDVQRPTDLQKSRILHRLRVLAIPGLQRHSDEKWTMQWTLETESALIEAAIYGGTLEAAAGARLEERIRDASGQVDVLAAVLTDAVLVGIDTLSNQVLNAVRESIDQESRLGVLGGALRHLLGLWRYTTARAPLLGETLVAGLTRGLWLIEGLQGVDEGTVPAVVAFRDTIRYGEGLDIDAEVAAAVMERRLSAGDVPPALRGAALGFLWSLETAAALPMERILQATWGCARPDALGDFLHGLFALAREEVQRAEGLLDTLDTIVSDMTRQEFLEAAPALRLAFNYFPPKEKEKLARRLLRRRGQDELQAREMVRRVDGDQLLFGSQLEAAVTERARRYGLE